jgi:hypothetical protein
MHGVPRHAEASVELDDMRKKLLFQPWRLGGQPYSVRLKVSEDVDAVLHHLAIGAHQHRNDGTPDLRKYLRAEDRVAGRFLYVGDLLLSQIGADLAGVERVRSAIECVHAQQSSFSDLARRGTSQAETPAKAVA